jgi:hypothetical protein
MAQTSVKLKIDNSYVKAAVQYNTALQKRFERVRNKKFSDPVNVSQIEFEGLRIVQQAVYANGYQPVKYVITGNAARSIKAANTSTKDQGEITLYSDVQIAAAKLNPGYSYLGFFESPVEFNSFIKPRGFKHAGNFRPFFKLWEKQIESLVVRMAKDATDETLEELQPQILK